MPAQSNPSADARPSLVDRLLRPFSRVNPGEGLVAVLMLACVFLILCSYYLMKTAREGLILSERTHGLGGQEVKAYASGVMALLLVGIVPAYSALAERVRRIRLVNLTYAFVLACLAVFFALDELGVPIGIPFYIWIGLVNVLLVAQFWSYATDIYTEEQGKRLFAIIALGGSLGGVLGPRLASLAPTGQLLIVAAALLVPCIVLLNLVEHVHAPRSPDTAHAPIPRGSSFGLLVRDRYLLLIAGVVFIGALVKTIGEYVLSDAAAAHAAELVPNTAHPDLIGRLHDAAIASDRREIIKSFYSSFFFWVNLTGFVIQAAVVSRVIDKLGVRRAIFVMPIIALGAYGAIAAIGGLALVRIAKVAENGTDYSLENTLRQTLFLPTPRDAKYKVKAAIDTLVVRAGDTVSAVLIWAGLHAIGFGGRAFAIINIALVAVWLVLAAGIAHRHRALVGGTAS